MARDIDSATRERIRQWIRYLRHKYMAQYPTQEAFGEQLGVGQGTVSQLLSGRGKPAIGLDTFIKMHRNLGASLDDVLDHPAPPIESLGEAPPGRPTRASRAPASPRRQKASGG